MRFLLAALLMFSGVPSALAAKMTFNVNLSGTSDLGNTLTVFGAIRIDPTLPIDNSNIGPYSLFVQRNAETPTRSLAFFALAVPNDTLGTVQMNWSLVGDALYVSRTSAEDSSINYTGFTFFPTQLTASFNFGSGAYEHAISYGDASGSETAVLKGASGPDGPNGFLVGNAVATVPAPSSFGLSLASICLMAAFVRPRRS